MISTCAWAAAATRIVWGRVKAFELVTDPSYFDEEPRVRAEECERVEPAGKLTLTVIDDLLGSGPGEVEVMIGADQIEGMNPTPRLDQDGNIYWAGQSNPGLVPGQEFGLALDQPEGSDQWFMREEQFLPLDSNGRLALPPNGFCCIELPSVFSGGTLQDLRTEIEACDGSEAEPWLPGFAAEDTDRMIYYGSARCRDESPAMGGAGGEGGGP